jgi:alpha-1,2-glucosyltransferase
VSCLFRQTNVIWVLYAYATTQVMHLRYRRTPPGQQELAKFHDPLALEAGPGMIHRRQSGIFGLTHWVDDLMKTLKSLPGVLPDLMTTFVPYAGVLVGFTGFVIWNGGIVLGKNHHQHYGVCKTEWSNR